MLSVRASVDDLLFKETGEILWIALRHWLGSWLSAYSWFLHDDGRLVVRSRNNPVRKNVGQERVEICLYRRMQLCRAGRVELCSRPEAPVQFFRNQVRKMQDRYNGWAIDFTKNVHMHTHSFKAEKSGEIYDLPCEDTPFGYVGIWPLGLHLDAPLLQDLLRGLVTGQSKRTYLIGPIAQGPITRPMVNDSQHAGLCT